LEGEKNRKKLGKNWRKGEENKIQTNFSLPTYLISSIANCFFSPSKIVIFMTLAAQRATRPHPITRSSRWTVPKAPTPSSPFFFPLSCCLLPKRRKQRLLQLCCCFFCLVFLSLAKGQPPLLFIIIAMEGEEKREEKEGRRGGRRRRRRTRQEGEEGEEGEEEQEEKRRATKKIKEREKRETNQFLHTLIYFLADIAK